MDIVVIFKPNVKPDQVTPILRRELSGGNIVIERAVLDGLDMHGWPIDGDKSIHLTVVGERDPIRVMDDLVQSVHMVS